MKKILKILSYLNPCCWHIYWDQMTKMYRFVSIPLNANICFYKKGIVLFFAIALIYWFYSLDRKRTCIIFYVCMHVCVCMYLFLLAVGKGEGKKGNVLPNSRCETWRWRRLKPESILAWSWHGVYMHDIECQLPKWR